jgi:hypothetical protein
MRKSMANGKEDGTGIKARAMAEGKCVNTIVCQELSTELLSTLEALTWTFPMRLAIEEATSMEMEDMMLVVKKSDPSFPS